MSTTVALVGLAMILGGLWAAWPPLAVIAAGVLLVRMAAVL